MIEETTKPILTLENLTIALPKGADRPFAVDNVSLSLNRGEILCLAGESGSGKSVLASALMGAVPKGLKLTQGSIWMEDKDLATLSEKALRRLRGNQIAMIFQEPVAALNPSMKIGAQIEEIFQIHERLDAATRKKMVRQLALSTNLPNIDRILDSYPHQLSGGQCQRVIIACALAMNPKILIADEPTTALDVTTQAQILALVRQLRDDHGHGIIFITHDFGVVADIADRVGVMRYGELVEIGQAKDILTNPQHPYTQELIAAVPSLHPPARGEGTDEQKTALKVENLAHSYGALSVLKDINFSLAAGEIISIVGESGCGKSTLAKALIHLIDVRQGRISIDGQNLSIHDKQSLRLSRRKLQMIFQGPHSSLNPKRSIGPVIARAGQLSGLNRRQSQQQARELLDLVGLGAQSYWRKPSAFSGGQRQRIGIARALAMRPDVLIADESVSALDVSVQQQVLDLLRDLQRQFKLAILFITHDLRVAAQISDHIIVMQAGEIVERGLAGQVLQNPVHPYTLSLIEAAPGRDIF